MSALAGPERGMPERWLLAPAPHGHSGETVPQIMWTVALALAPTCVAGVVIFGLGAARTILIAVAGAVVSEALVQLALRRRVTVRDGSAVVTGVLLACCLPPNCRWHVPLVGALVAILVGKQAFGGLGRNYFNPALVGRAFLQLVFPQQLTLSVWPVAYKTALFGSEALKVAGGQDAYSMATPLGLIKPGVAAADSPIEAIRQELHQESWGDVVRDLFVGNVPGCLGEVSKLAIILGGLILLANRYVDWRLPLAYVGASLAGVLLLPVRDAGGAWTGLYAPEIQWAVIGQTLLVHLLSGGLVLGACFMITDTVTRPATPGGMVVYGLIGGALVALIRLYSGFYPEGVCYSILLVNGLRLVVEKCARPRVFGARLSGPAGRSSG